MTDYRKKKGDLKVTRVPVDVTTETGLKVRAGQWLVVEDGEERALDDDEFKREFEPDVPAHQMVRHGGDRLARSRHRETELESVGPHDREPFSLEKATGRSLKDLVSGALSNEVDLPGREVRDENGQVARYPSNMLMLNSSGQLVPDPRAGQLMRSPGLRADTGRKPKMKYTFDAEGTITGGTLEPEEFPPRGEKF